MFLPSRTSRLLICLAGVLLFVSGLARTQQSNVATVGFTCDFPGSTPSHYDFSVTSTRQASYTSDGKLSAIKNPESEESSTDEGPYRVDFMLSPATTAHIFELAKSAQYFAGNVDSRKKNLAFTGDKTLTYRDAGKRNVANYNYSLIPAVQELTVVFQNLSAVVEFGHRLEYEYRYQKLALDEEMKRMDETTALQDVGPDLPAAVPILQKIADDPSVINPVRAHAMRLLQHAGASGK